jgi:arabinofuranosyltransferase
MKPERDAEGETKEEPRRRRGLLLLGLALVAFLAHAYFLRGIVEDAFITFRFARNLASSHGIVWNAGEPPVEGYTNFSWLALSALFFRLDWDVPRLMQAAGVAASVATLVLSYRFARKLFGMPPEHAAIPAACLAASGPFASWSTSGMETTFFAFLLLASAYAFCRWVASQRALHLGLAFGLLLLATLTRPEGFFVFALLAALSFALVLAARRPLSKWALVLPVYVVPFLVYFVWRFEYFGYPLPNTFYAKTGGGLLQALRGVRYTALFALQYVTPWLLVLVPLAWEVVPKFANLERPKRPSLSWLEARAPVIVCAVLAVVYVAYVAAIGGDYMAMYRFFVPALPFSYLLAGLAVHELFQRGLPHRLRGYLSAALFAFALVLTLWPSMPVKVAALEKPSFMHGTLQGVAYERWCVARYTLIGRFFDEYGGKRGKSLAVGPIGAVGHYARMPIHSTYGIVDAHIAHGKSLKEPIGLGFPGHEKEDLLYVLGKNPDLILIAKRFSPEPLPYPDFSKEPQGEKITAIVRSRYVRRWVWLEDRVNRESGYFTFLERTGPAVTEGPVQSPSFVLDRGEPGKRNEEHAARR